MEIEDIKIYPELKELWDIQAELIASQRCMHLIVGGFLTNLIGNQMQEFCCSPFETGTTCFFLFQALI